MPKDQLHLEMRPMTREDLPAVVALSRLQGRNIHPDDYERLLDLEGSHPFVITADGQVKGAITVMRYFEHGWMGPLLLEEGLEGSGFSIALATHMVSSLQRTGVPIVEAEASDQDARLLDGMGFERVRETVVLERPPAAATGRTAGTTGMEEHHLLDVGALDASAFGYGRKQYIHALLTEYPEGARVLLEDGEVRGFVLVRRSRRGYHLGPLVTAPGAGVEVARRLLTDALEAAAGWPVVALVPEGSPLLEPLFAEGFVRVGQLHRMRAGTPLEKDADAAQEWVVGSRFTG